jgi:septum formation protein
LCYNVSSHSQYSQIRQTVKTDKSTQLTKMTSLLLASQSPRRRELLALLGLPFKVSAPHVTETLRTDESPTALAVRLSQAKARAAYFQSLSSPGPDRAIIVACDTVVVHDGEALGKPHDAAEAISMLNRLRGRRHIVQSAITLLAQATDHVLTDVAETQVMMRSYTDAEVAAYVASRDPMDKAGAYAIQHSGFHPVVELQGCYANVMGLPLCHLTRCLHAWAIEPAHDAPTACQAHIGRACPVYKSILNSG